MRHLLDILSDELKRAFRECGYDDAKVSVTVSNRPDL